MLLPSGIARKEAEGAVPYPHQASEKVFVGKLVKLLVCLIIEEYFRDSPPHQTIIARPLVLSCFRNILSHLPGFFIRTSNFDEA